MMWDCNGLPQQQWGYDANEGTIYLKESDQDASLCLDAFANIGLGNQVQVWGCNLLPQQLFDVNWGTTIRIAQEYKMCLDVILPAAPGALTQLWECNGHPNQQFIFDPSTGQLIYGGDPDLQLCVDAHDLGTPGTRLYLWGCNDLGQQQWGYDLVMQTLYLAQSTSVASDAVVIPLGSGVGHAMASICIDLGGGAVAEGSFTQTWGCNGCWNQQWLLGGGITQQPDEWVKTSFTTARKLQGVPVKDLSGGCPALPPAPTPPPAPSSTCLNGWPSFKSSQDLAADPGWGGYITEIYGGIPDESLQSYPWCMGSLWALYIDRIQAHGAKTPRNVGTCPTNKGKNEGDLYTINNQFQPSNLNWIWHPGPFKHFESNTWVEVIHMSGLADENVGAWFFYAKGAGIWLNLGRTIWFTDHGDAFRYFKTPADNPKMAAAAKTAGYDTVQFLQHSDCEFKQCNKHTPYLNYEFVSTQLVGKYSCGSSDGNSPLLRTGWQGANACKCDNKKQNSLNCDGIPVQAVKKPLGDC